MLRHSHIDRICSIVLVLTLLATGGYMAACASGLIAGSGVIGYETRLFDPSRVHTIDIVMDGWEDFIATATSEEYSACTIVIDGEKYANAAIRGKGNTSLSNVASYGNDRYSFKVEFDHFQPGMSYHGLDKLSLNNLIQDPTCMKDYLAYTLMGKMGVAAPLCSFVQVSVNGEPWGFYLAVEGVEDSFLTRNYGANHGELYKPDSMSFGGGRGNGRNFNMEDFAGQTAADDALAIPSAPGNAGRGGMGFPGMSGMVNERGEGQRGMGSMGSADVMLQYIDDDPASYQNIFDNAKTDVNADDQTRLIAALKTLSDPETAASTVDQDAVIRYFAVHNFLCNDDSYTGSMIHNYYLYEENGVLAMIPWDYNLAYGTMSGSNATSSVNADIDRLVSMGSDSDRPMASWITASEEYMAQYHAIYQEFMTTVFDSGWFAEEIDRVTAMITPYVEADPTAFCTYEEFLTGAETLKQFCLKRAQSVTHQLSGEDTRVDASELTLSAMGTMGNMGGPGGDRGGFERPGRNFGGEDTERSVSVSTPGPVSEMPVFDMPTAMPEASSDSSGSSSEQADAEATARPEASVEPKTSEAPNVDEAWVRPGFGGEFDITDRSPGTNASESWIWIAACTVLLGAAFLFVRFYRTNR